MQLLYSPKCVGSWQVVEEVGEAPTKELLQRLIITHLGYSNNVFNKRIENIISNMADQLLRYHRGFIAGPVYFTDGYFALVDDYTCPDNLGQASCSTCWYGHTKVYCQERECAQDCQERECAQACIRFCTYYTPDFEYRLISLEEIDDYWEKFKSDEEAIRGI